MTPLFIFNKCMRHCTCRL